MIGVAVNVTEFPGQIVVALAAILTEGVIRSFTVMVIVLLVAVAGEGQIALEVMITLTVFVFASVEVVNMGLFVPTFTPLTCH